MIACNVLISAGRKEITEDEIKKVVDFFCRQNKIKKMEVGVLLVGEKTMRSLNRRYRGRDKVTDVLSFAAKEGKIFKNDDWGDVFICPSYIHRQAKNWAENFEIEWKRILIHGLLHLRGFDHEKEKDAKKMFAKQEKILNEYVY